MYKVLVIGSGGREHAIADAFFRGGSDRVFVSPGNGGMQDIAACVNLPDPVAVARFCRDEKINCVFVGPEQPLAAGWVDYLRDEKVPVIGPVQNAARLETSKSFAKEIMNAAGVPTAAHVTVSTLEQALACINKTNPPLVLKADGLAAGKGVVICQTREEAATAAAEMLAGLSCGTAGQTLVLEEFLNGWEVSVFAFCDGQNYFLAPAAQDHKRIFDGDKGPNTGGMGAWCPVPLNHELIEEIGRTIIRPVLQECRQRGFAYTGVLYTGLMITPDGPRVVEFNCRLGDPETQALLPLLKSPMPDVCEQMLAQKLGLWQPLWHPGVAVTVVGASQGYPGAYSKGCKITVQEGLSEKTRLYWAGVEKRPDGLYTNGGRVLALTHVGTDINAAVAGAYTDMQKVNFDGMFYRRDIASFGLNRKV